MDPCLKNLKILGKFSKSKSRFITTKSFPEMGLS